MESFKTPINKSMVAPVEAIPGILRYTLAYNKESMLCLFEMKKGAKIPLHKHIHVQNGYCIKGKVQFFTQKGSFIVHTGDGYVFNSNEEHGAEILEDSEVVEIFTPCRQEYIPK